MRRRNAGDSAMGRSNYRLLAALAAASWLAGPASAAPTSKTFRDWIAGCDNLKSCTALSLPGEIGDDVAFLKLERAAGPGGGPRLSLKIRAEKLPSTLAVALALDGTPFPAPGRRWSTTGVDDRADIAFSSSDTEALIAAARKATKLTVAIADKSLDVSLAGSVAALLWIDEQQGRLNSTSALIRKGPGGAVPAAPPLPVIAARAAAQPTLPATAGKTLSAALRKQLKQSDPDACEDIPDGFDNSDDAWPLAGGSRLVGLACSRGAYNVSTGFWIVSGADVAKARKAAFPELDGGHDNMIVNGDFDPKTAQIGFFSKGRGIGDCGASGNYAWTGTAFVLTAFDVMGECKGITADDWITLFRSEVKVVK